MTEENMIDVPEVLEWSEEELAELGKRRRLPEDPIRFLVTGAESTISAKGHFMLVHEAVPLLDPTDETTTLGRYSVKNWTILPKKNTKVPAHKPLDTAGKCIGLMRAFEGPETIPFPARRNKSTGDWEVDGEVLAGGGDEAAVHNEDQKRTAMNLILEYYKDPSRAVGKTFVANVWYSEEGFMRLRGIRHDLGEGEDFADLTDFA